MNKNLNYYMGLNYDIKIRHLTEEEGGGWFAEIPLLPGCMSDSDSVDELLANLDDAKKCWINTCLEAGRPVPEPREESYSGQLRLRLPKSLHRTLTERAKEEEISLNQYIVYQLARSTGQPVK